MVAEPLCCRDTANHVKLALLKAFNEEDLTVSYKVSLQGPGEPNRPSQAANPARVWSCAK